jgi:hypothetical protein
MSDKRAGARLVDRRSTRRVPSREGQAQKAPQATFSNELGPPHFNREAYVDDTRQPDLIVDGRSPSHGAH